MAIRLNQVYGALAPLTEGNFQFGLNYGSGLGVSSGQLVNTGVLSLQGDTGSLSLSAGTGIGISGLTISNTGIISASAGNGISVSGTNPLSIAMSGSYSGNMTVAGSGTFNLINANINNTAGSTGGDEIIALWGGLQSFPTTTNAGMYGLGISGSTLEVYTDTNINFWQLGLNVSTPAFSIGGTYSLIKSAYNTLDDGSGNMTIAGNLTVNGSINLSAGTGIGISRLTISNTGIISASAGSGISVSGTNPLTITNTGVLSLQGDTGALSLSAGTGIGISGLTISNTGIISASAGSGISVSGTNPLTITNTGVVSLVNDSGSISLSGYTGVVTISVNTANPNSWSATQTIGALTVDDAVGGTAFTPNGNTAFAFYNGGFSSYVGEGEWLGFWRDNGNYFAPLIGEQNGAFIIAFANDRATTYNGLMPNTGTMAFAVKPSGAVYTGYSEGYPIPVSSGTSNSISVRNTLDDGAGNMTVAGSGTFNFINANINNTVGLKTGGDEIIALWGGLQPFPTATTSGMTGLGMRSVTLEVYTYHNIDFWQLGFSVSTPAFVIGGADNENGTYSLIKSAYNTLDDGSGNMSISGNLTLKYYNSATFTALYTTTNTGGINGNGVEGVYNTLTNSMTINIGTATISVFSVFGEHNSGGGTGVGVLITSVSYGAGAQIPYDSSDIIAYFPAISTAGNTGDDSSTQTWIASGVANTGGTCYIVIASQETCCIHYLEFNHTVITFP